MGNARLKRIEVTVRWAIEAMENGSTTAPVLEALKASLQKLPTTPETRRRMSAAHKGKKASPETRAKMSASARKYYSVRTTSCTTK